METVGLNHFNITAPYELLEKVRDFYVEVLGLAVGERPNFSRKGFWLYAGQQPIVHLIDCADDEQRASGQSGTCYVDHIAFTCKGLAGLIERLKRLNIVYQVSELTSTGQVQVFVRDPAGVGVEMNFLETA